MINSARQSGFIALISAIIISALLLTITFTLNRSGLSNRFNILDSDSKERSSNLAEACVDKAIYNLVQDPTYNPINQRVAVGSDTCVIVSKELSGSQTIFKTQAVINRAYTNLAVTVDNNYNVLSWQEVADF